MNPFSSSNTLPSTIRWTCLSLLLALTGPWTQSLSAQSLPYHGTATSSSTIWWITQLGLGPAGEFEISNASNTNPALLATTNSSGPALRASAGTGLAGDFGGKVRMSGFQLSTSPIAGYVLTSDASGNGIWKKLPADSDPKYFAGAGLILSGTTFSIASGGVTSSMLAAGSVIAPAIAAGAITSSALAAGAVNTAALADGAVTTSKIAWPLSETLASSSPLLSLTNTGAGDGVFGSSSSYVGVHGVSSSNVGVYGTSNSSTGVVGSSSSGDGGDFQGGNEGVYAAGVNYGVFGVATGSNTGTPYGGYFVSDTYGAYGNGGLFGVWGASPYNGVAAIADNANGNGVNAECDYGVGVLATADYGEAVYGQSKYGWAGYFLGDADVTGSLYAGAKYFKIDHPLDPTNKYLIHACVESDQMTNVYSGNIVLDANGQATVELADWFEALNKDFRYQLTAIGAPGPNLYVAEKVHNNRFCIAGGQPGMEVSWQVSGIRQDAYATAHPLQVEQDKPEDRRGKYLHPKERGQSESLGEDYNRKLSLKQMPHGQLPAQPTPGR